MNGRFAIPVPRKAVWCPAFRLSSRGHAEAWTPNAFQFMGTRRELPFAESLLGEAGQSESEEVILNSCQPQKHPS